MVFGSLKNSLIVRIVILGFIMMISFAGCAGMGSTSPDGNTDGVLLGVFHEGSQLDLAPVKLMEKQLEKKIASVMWYLDWSTPFPSEDVRRVSDAGYMPHITWEPWFFEARDMINLDDILQGKWNDYIREWALGAADFGKPMFLRWGHEFNGNWYPWSVARNGNDAAKYVQAYKKIHWIFKKAGADNVRWIWCVNANSVPNEPWNDPLKAFPGFSYVDWIGLDGYNFSGSDSFKDLFGRIYAKIILNTNKPIMIAEFATGGNGKVKADWLKQMGEDLKSFFPAVKAITWFDIDKELDWRLLVDEQTIQAAKSVFASDYFLSDPGLFGPVAESYPLRREEYISQIDSLIPPPVQRESSAIALTEDMQPLQPWISEKSIYLESGSGKDDLSAEMSFRWTTTSLYFQAVITDDVPVFNNKTEVNIWNGDCVEICIGLDENADKKREYFFEKDFQLGFSPGSKRDNIEPSAWGWGGLNKAPESVQLLISLTDNGYIVVGSIPWKSLSADFIPVKGMKLGFDCAIDDTDDSGDRESQTIWNGDSSFYSNPSQWGILVLE
ncbi:MAG: hypothetical protein JXJ04_05750 [Spirochaetales bacterium]|nr:hypothetical protein [Spirochaetales bacterium]